MAEQTPIPEPPDGAHILVGEDPLVVLLIRDDQGADQGVWWPVTNDTLHLGPFTWGQLTAPESEWDGDELLLGINRRAIQRVYSQAEVDRLVAEARSVRLGRHVREPGGYCSTCGHDHAETEWARIYDQLEQEGDNRG